MLLKEQTRKDLKTKLITAKIKNFTRKAEK